MLFRSQVACEMHDGLLDGLTKLKQFQGRELIRKTDVEKLVLGGWFSKEGTFSLRKKK